MFKEHAEAHGLLPRPSLPACPHTLCLAASSKAKCPSTESSSALGAWDPGSAVTGGLQWARATLEPPSAQSEKRLFSLRCPWQAFCLSLQIPLLFSTLLSAAPLCRSRLRRGFRLPGAPAGDLITTEGGPGVSNRSTSDEEGHTYKPTRLCKTSATLLLCHPVSTYSSVKLQMERGSREQGSEAGRISAARRWLGDPGKSVSAGPR